MLRTVNDMRTQFKNFFLSASLILIGSATSQATPITVYIRDAFGGVNQDNTPGGVFLANTVVKDADKIQGYKVPAGAFSLEMSFNNPNGPYVSVWAKSVRTRVRLAALSLSWCR